MNKREYCKNRGYYARREVEYWWFMLNGYLWCIISPYDSGWSCRGELFITVFAMIDEGGKGWHRDYVKEMHKIEEK